MKVKDRIKLQLLVFEHFKDVFTAKEIKKLFNLGEKITNFLESEDKELEVDFIPISHYSRLFSLLGFKYLNEEFDTNGWEITFWTYFVKDKTRIMLRGSLYYGNFKLVKE